MNAKNLGILAALAAVAAGVAAVAVWRQREAVAPRSETGLLLPGLADKVNAVATIEVRSGDKTATIRRDPARPDAPWTVDELGGYPAKFETVRQALVGLAMLEKVEPRTDRPDLYDKIGVEDPAPGKDSRLVTLSGPGADAAVILGKSKWAGSTQQVYARPAGQARSWLASGDVTISADPMEWIDKQILTIDSSRIQMAIVNQPEGAQLVVSRGSPDGAWEIADLPEGRALKNSTVAAAAATPLAFINAEAVRPADQIDWSGAATSEYRTFDGLLITVTTVERDGECWARFASDFEPSVIPPAVPAPPADGHEMTDEEAAGAQKAADEERARKIERVRAESDGINQRLGPWAFKIPKFKAEVLRRTMEDLLAAPSSSVPPANQPPEDAGNDGDITDEPDAEEWMHPGDAPGDEPAEPGPESAEPGADHAHEPRDEPGDE